MRGQSGRSFWRVALSVDQPRLVLRPWGRFILSNSSSPSCLGLLGLKAGSSTCRWMAARAPSIFSFSRMPKVSIPSRSTRTPVRVMSASTWARGNSMLL